MVTFNQMLKEKRIDKNLSIKETAKKIGVPSFVLKGAEQGYYPLPKKSLEKLCVLFDYDFITLYQNTYSYNNIEKGQVKRTTTGKFNKFIKKLSVRIFLIVLAVLTVASFTTCAFFKNKARNDYRFFCSKELCSFTDFVVKNGSLLANNKYFYEIVTPDSKVRFDVYSESSKIFFYNITTNYNSTQYEYSINTSIENEANLKYPTLKSTMSLTNYDGTTCEYICSSFRKGKTTLKIISILEDGKILQEGTEKFEEVKGYMLQLTLKNDELLDDTFKTMNIGITDSYSFLSSTVNNKLNWEIVSVAMTPIIYVSAILFCITALLIFFSFADVFVEKTKIEITNENTLLHINNNQTLQQKKPHHEPLPKDIKLFPPIREEDSRIIGLIFLLIGSIGLFLQFAGSMKLWNIEQWSNISTITESLKIFLPLSYIIIIYNKLDFLSKKTAIIKDVITYLMLGIVYYVIEILVLMEFSSLDTSTYEKLSSLAPGNIFFGLATYVTMSLFLFTSPNKIKNSPIKLFLWRCGILIPIIYFVVGYCVKYSQYFFNIQFTPLFRVFFFSDNIVVALFAFGLFAIKYMLQKPILKKYGNTNSQLFLTGNRYACIHNLLCTIFLALLMLADFLIGMFVPNSSSYGFGMQKLAFIGLPIVLLTAHYNGKRNAKSDFIYIIFYGLITITPYLLVGIASLTS